MRINQNRSQVLFGLAAFGVVAYGGMLSVHLRYGTLRDGHVTETLAWYGLAFVVYAAGIAWVEWSGRFSWKLVLGAAILFRLLLLFTQPTLSDDIYRYIWDGYVANEGVSPYAYPIDSPELDYLDIPERGLANNAWMASPYLPAAQVFFRGLTWQFPLKAIYFQVAAVVFDLMSAWIISRLLTAVHLPPRRILLYLWNPLVIVETAHSAHIDALMVLLTLVGVWFVVGDPGSGVADRGVGRRLVSPLFMGLGVLTKILPGLLAPILVWRWRWWQTVLFGMTIVGLLVPAGLRAGWGLSGPLDGRGLFGALRIYGSGWNFNSGLFHWLEVFLLNLGVEEANSMAKGVMSLLMIGVLLAVFFVAWRYRNDDLVMLRLSAVPFMAYMLFTTTVHPWYIHILLAFVPFLPGIYFNAEDAERQRSRGVFGWLVAAPWIYLSGALGLSYITYIDPLDFREFEWVRQLEWLPVLILLVAAVLWVVIGRRLNIDEIGRKPFRT